MAHVIDSLVVELGLDPTKFNQQQRDALDKFKQNNQEFERGAGEVEDATRRAGISIGQLRRTAADAFSLFTGGKSVVNMVTEVTHADAAVGRLSRSLGENASTIAKWQGVARIFGGSAETMASSFTAMTDAFSGFKLGVASQTVADLRAISSAGGVEIKIDDSTNEKFLKLAENLKNIYGKDPAQAGFLGRRLGLDPAMIDILIQGRGKAQEFLDVVEKIGVATKQSTENAASLERQWAEIKLRTEDATRSVMGGWIGRVIKGMNEGAASDIEAIANFDKDPWGSLASIFGYGKAKQRATVNPEYPATTGAFKNQQEKEAFIRSEATKAGIDPDVAMRIARSEGFDTFKSTIPGERSYGAFQLNYSKNPSRPSLGDLFTKETGLDASDPANEAAGIRYALAEASKKGWGQWYGRRTAGVGIWDGIGRGGGKGGGDTNINGPITINASSAEGGQAAARSFKDEMLKQQNQAANNNYGQM